MKIASIIAVALFGVGLVLGLGCGGDSGQATGPTPTTTETVTVPQVMVTANDSGGVVAVGLGENLVVTLESNPTTGFEWALVSISDEDVLHQVDGAQYIPNPTPTGEPIVGSGGNEVWTFRARGAGTSTIEMMYARPWESVEPAARFNITVTVE